MRLLVCLVFLREVNDATLAVMNVQLYKLVVLLLVLISMHADIDVGIDISVVVNFDVGNMDRYPTSGICDLAPKSR